VGFARVFSGVFVDTSHFMGRTSSHLFKPHTLWGKTIDHTLWGDRSHKTGVVQKTPFLGNTDTRFSHDAEGDFVVQTIKPEVPVAPSHR
jgi:hypothetical protein